MSTILAIRKDDIVYMASDGQLTSSEDRVVSNRHSKVSIPFPLHILLGKCGFTTDSEKLEDLLMDNYDEARDLEDIMQELSHKMKHKKLGKFEDGHILVSDNDKIIHLNGLGDITIAEDNVYSIGSGGVFAEAAATALLENTRLSVENILSRAIEIASRRDVFTNNTVFTLRLP